MKHWFAAKSRTDSCHRDKHRRAVASVAKLAEELDSSVIAEGIEDPADLEKPCMMLVLRLSKVSCFVARIGFDQLWKQQESDDFCACSLGPRTKTSQCQLKDLGLCSRMSGRAIGNEVQTCGIAPISDHPNSASAL